MSGHFHRCLLQLLILFHAVYANEVQKDKAKTAAVPVASIRLPSRTFGHKNYF